MHGSTDLSAYFARISYDGPAQPTLPCLQGIHLRHAQAIAFENLNPLLGLPVALDPAALHAKLIHAGRGGYCFEQNLLLQHVLTQLGFNVRGLLARVLWMRPQTAVSPRTHMVLLVELEGANYIADVGFGGLTLTAPLRLEGGREQQTPHEPFRLVEQGGGWTLQALFKDEWQTLYLFDLTPQYAVDFEVSNWYTSAHPRSPFVSNLFTARPAPGCRFALRNNEFTVHHSGASTERTILTTAGQLADVLANTFGLVLPEHPSLEGVLARVASGESV